MKPIRNEKKKISFLQSILIIFFSFELNEPLDFTIAEPPKKLLMFFVAMMRGWWENITGERNTFDIFVDEDDDL